MRDSFARALVGRTLAGRYELGDAIGAGGMSVVYRGMDRVLGRPVAVKVVALAAESDEMRANLRERFRREAGSAARIAHHPNIVQVYDYGTDPELDLDFIVMELLRGRDLKQALLQGGGLPAAQALRIVREAARGLAAGHREGIVHRDVKPANVFLVGADGDVDYVRVLDFGIAKPLEPDDDALTLTTAGQLPHSPAYASPEQTSPELPVTPASDVYQLGLIAYELLAGERPYTEADRTRIRAGEPVAPARGPRWEAVDAPVRAVIERALSHDPAARYPDAGAFADALAEAEEGGAGDETRTIASYAAAPASPAAVVVRDDAGDEDDATAFAPAVADVPAIEAAAIADDATGLAPATPMVTPEPVSSQPVSLPPVPRQGRRTSPAVWGIPLVLLVLALGVWASRHRAGARAGAVVADTGALGALHGTFLRLEGAASAAMDSGGTVADTAVAEAPRDTTPRDTTPAPDPSAAAAAATQQVAGDLNAAWSAGEVDRMIGHYAGHVDYYNVANASRSFVRGKIRDSVRRYDRRVITIKRQATVLDTPTQARVLVDKEWDFTGSKDHWVGSMRQELTMRLDDGEWKIVAERGSDVRDSHQRP